MRPYETVCLAVKATGIDKFTWKEGRSWVLVRDRPSRALDGVDSGAVPEIENLAGDRFETWEARNLKDVLRDVTGAAGYRHGCGARGWSPSQVAVSCLLSDSRPVLLSVVHTWTTSICVVSCTG